MDTKSRKFNAILFIICVAMFTTFMVTGATMAGDMRTMQGEFWSPEDALRGKNYENSDALQSRFADKYREIGDLLADMKARSGADISYSESVADAMQRLYESGEYVTAEGDRYRAIYPPGMDGSEDYAYPEIREAFLAVNQDTQAAILASLIRADANDLQYRQERLDAENGFLYYAKHGNAVITNMRMEHTEIDADAFGHKAYFFYQDGLLKKQPASAKSVSWKTLDSGIETALNRLQNENSGEDLKIYFAFNADNMAAAKVQYDNANAVIGKLLPLLIISGLLTLVSFIWLVIITGRKDEDGNRKLYALDKTWTEVQLAGIFFALLLGAFFMGNFLFSSHRVYVSDYAYGYDISMYYAAGNMLSSIEIAIASAVIAALAAVGLWFVLSVVRLIKARMFFRNSLIYKLGKIVIDLLADIINGKGILRKAMVVTLAICLLSATVFLAPVVFIAIILLLPIWARRFDEIQQGIDEVRSGNLSHKIPVYDDKKAVELSRLAEGINEISEASNVAVQNELKNQRMKTELISNVSHDLKTPLTSMVSYIDLLKTEGLDSENAPEYLNILDQKTERLTKLTEDLFEAAKASSGAMPVNLEKIDLPALLHQSLGEMSKGIEESGLEFIINAPEERYFVTADGRLLWRVVENLLGNVLKYAQEKSRVYIEIKELKSGKEVNGVRSTAGNMVILEIKNISRQALNIEPDELMERFKRGDEARTTDGSGLGLAITNDLVRLMNGWFEITIDGDLFKTTVMLNKANL